MNVTLAHIGARPAAKDEFDALTAVYLGRCSAFAHCKAEAFRTEDALLDWLQRLEGRTPAVTVLLDSRGRQMTSEVFAAWLGTRPMLLRASSWPSSSTAHSQFSPAIPTTPDTKQ